VSDIYVGGTVRKKTMCMELSEKSHTDTKEKGETDEQE
jgi:hypothetical protein